MEKGESSRSPTHNQLALQDLTQLNVAVAILLGGLCRLLAQGPRARTGEDVEGLKGGDRALPGEARLRTGSSCCGGVGPGYKCACSVGARGVPGGGGGRDRKE